MKKLLPILIIGIFVLSGLGAGAIQIYNEAQEIEISDSQTSTSPRDYTHTVLVEVGTATWCPSCPASNTAWHTIYEGGNYDFEYTELVYDKNSGANSRFSQFNPKYVPTSYWDGGFKVLPGTNYGTFYNYLDASGARAVSDLDSTLNVAWLGGTEMEIDYQVDNNEANSYPGRLRIYVQELVSTHYIDNSGNPYYHGFLDFAEDKSINIPASGSISDTITWDGASEGFPGVTSGNIQVILAVFDDEGHTSYSDPPSGNPFTAYYSEECIAAVPTGGQNNPPGAPVIGGPTNGNAGTSYDYTFTSVDPDGDDVKFLIKWDDGDPEWTSFTASGNTLTVSHTYADQGTYNIQANAKDTIGAESGYSSYQVTMPRNKAVNSFLYKIMQYFPILSQLLGQ